MAAQQEGVAESETRGLGGRIATGAQRRAFAERVASRPARLRPPEREPGERLVDYRELLTQTERAPSVRDSTTRRVLALVDVVALLAAFLVSGFAAPLPTRTPQLALVLPLWVLLNKLLGLYDRDACVIDKATLHELPKLAESAAIGGALIFLVGPTIDLTVHRRQAVAFFAVAVLVMVLLRTVVRVLVRHRYGPERVMIVGSGVVARLIARKLRAHSNYGVEIVGCVDVATEADDGDDGSVTHLGEISRFASLCRSFDIDRVVVAFSALDHEHLLDTIRASKMLGVKLSVVPRLFEVVGRSAVIDEVEGMSLLSLRGLSRARSSLALKRTIDLAGATFGLLLLTPLMLLIAAAVKLSSRGPVLFAQDRIGRDNRRFTLYKFRTMVDGADALKSDLARLNEAQYPMFKIAQDPRVTRVGRILRRTSLDELPQLWNVVRGEMSLVGPRPLVPSEDAHVIGWHRARLELTPGLTGPWQVLGRNAIPFDEMVRLDYLYVADWSIWNDVKLLIRTAPVVFKRAGQ